MRITWLGLLLLALGASAGAVRGQVVTYEFGSTAAPSTAATAVAANLSASVFSGNQGSPATGSGTPVYSAGSGGGFFTATSWTGAAPGSNYFEFTLTPNSGYSFSLSSLSFGYRATGSGPTAFAVRSNADAFASSLIAGAITNDSAWHSTGTLSITMSGLTAPTTLRIYASGASSSLGTLRVDDVIFNGAVTAVPEPSTCAAILGTLALAGVIIRRRRQARAA